MAKTEDLLDHSGEDECPVCRAFDLAYDVVIPALAAWENHYGLKEGQLGLATVLTAASALLEADLADRAGLEAALAEYLDEAAAGRSEFFPKTSDPSAVADPTATKLSHMSELPWGPPCLPPQCWSIARGWHQTPRQPPQRPTQRDHGLPNVLPPRSRCLAFGSLGDEIGDSQFLPL